MLSMRNISAYTMTFGHLAQINNFICDKAEEGPLDGVFASLDESARVDGLYDPVRDE